MVVLAVSGRFFQKLIKETQLLEFEKALFSSFPSVRVRRQRVAEKDSYRRQRSERRSQLEKSLGPSLSSFPFCSSFF